jgi:hypothetical protein
MLPFNPCYLCHFGSDNSNTEEIKKQKMQDKPAFQVTKINFFVACIAFQKTEYGYLSLFLLIKIQCRQRSGNFFIFFTLVMSLKFVVNVCFLLAKVVDRCFEVLDFFSENTITIHINRVKIKAYDTCTLFCRALFKFCNLLETSRELGNSRGVILFNGQDNTATINNLTYIYYSLIHKTNENKTNGLAFSRCWFESRLALLTTVQYATAL